MGIGEELARPGVIARDRQRRRVEFDGYDLGDIVAARRDERGIAQAGRGVEHAPAQRRGRAHLRVRVAQRVGILDPVHTETANQQMSARRLVGYRLYCRPRASENRAMRSTRAGRPGASGTRTA